MCLVVHAGEYLCEGRVARILLVEDILNALDPGLGRLPQACRFSFPGARVSQELDSIVKLQEEVQFLNSVGSHPSTEFVI